MDSPPNKHQNKLSIVRSEDLIAVFLNLIEHSRLPTQSIIKATILLWKIKSNH